MNISEYKNEVVATITEPMISYMEEWPEDCSYTAQDVEKCKAILFEYLEALDAITEPDDEAIMEQVKNVVEALNTLNEETDYSLIETDAREDICEFINTTAAECGLEEFYDDVTEEWREW
ncbi:MAG: hypothetical protein IKV52_00400 [Oscillospiraceae bacterium]|nr:hypothetical protein [Oscillospiraceae bacterium]MBR5251268.1 hypothetical protein [Oscillospiraceae bacterium]